MFKKEILTNSGWHKLAEHFNKPYMQKIALFLHEQIQQGINIYPNPQHIFRAFELTPLSQVKVVILGQDPYHNPKQAHGLSFSVNKGIKIPPSLQNIFKELQINPAHGDLSNWAKQGVLLLNSVLTVEHNKPASHQHLGWQFFTDSAISLINDECQNVVFMLWGNYAQQKVPLIDANKQLILTASHPSPLSAHRGFLGCNHFVKANDYLRKNHINIVDWHI